MKSRREVARKELFIKSKLISSVDGDKTIESNRSMKRSWVRIFEAK
jgi:diketogulonate reductase-like aldo/keto reductase